MRSWCWKTSIAISNRAWNRIDAAVKGAREIAFAVVAMTLTLAAVYAPLAFATGRTGRLFIEFALALAGAVLVSGFVALTLSPMLCSLILKHEVKHGKVYNAIESVLLRMTELYKRTLTAILHMPVSLAWGSGWSLSRWRCRCFSA